MFERRLSANVKLLAIVKLTAKLAYTKIKAVLPMYSFIMGRKLVRTDQYYCMQKKIVKFLSNPCGNLHI